MLSGEWKLNNKNTVPAALQDLLVREAAFSLSRKRIGEAVEVARASRDAVAAARPLLSFVRQDAKKDHREKLKEAEESIAILEAGAKKLDVTIPVLHQCVERSIENYLRELDPEYVNGLSASRFSADWQRILERYEQAVELYGAALEQLPALLETMVPNEICGAHFDGRQVIQDMAARAKAILREIGFINKVAEAQRLRAGSGNTSLERQPERNWGSLADSLLAVQPLAAARTVKQLIAESREVLENVHAAIRNQARLATYAGGYGVASYHESVWNSLRESASARLDPDQLEPILGDTERRIETGELAEFLPEPTPLPAAALAAMAAAPVAAGGLRVGFAGRKTDAAPVPAPPPVVPAPAAAASGRTLSLKIPGRNAPANAPRPGIPLSPMTPLPAMAAPSSPAAGLAPVPAPVPASASASHGTTLAELRAERERLDALRHETDASLREREKFLSQSEARLMQTSQAQLEREVELEQKEEQLRELERRLRELQPGLLPSAAEPAKKFDEFNE